MLQVNCEYNTRGTRKSVGDRAEEGGLGDKQGRAEGQKAARNSSGTAAAASSRAGCGSFALWRHVHEQAIPFMPTLTLLDKQREA